MGGANPNPIPGTTGPFLTQPAGAISGIPSLPQDNVISFDPERTDLQWRDNRWQLWSGNVFLKDFGHFEVEGREVLRVVRDMKLTSMNAIGAPRPVMEFWLANGQAPHGHIPGLRSLTLTPSTIKADQVQGQWCVHDGQRILFNFADQADAARQAAATIQRYNFTEVAYVGQVSPVMLVFLSNPTPPSPIQQAQHQEPSKNPFDTANLMKLFRSNQEQGPAMPNAQNNTPPGQMPPVTAQPLAPTPPTPPGPLTQVSTAPPTAARPATTIPGLNTSNERVTFPTRQLDVHRDGDDWKLTAGTTVLASFGPNQADAIMARAAMTHFQVTEEVFIGKPKPAMTYFLSNGHAPYGAMPSGLHATTFRPDSLSVQQSGQSFLITDGSQILLSCEHPGEAQQALQALQQYKFDRAVHIGSPDRGLTILTREK